MKPNFTKILLSLLIVLSLGLLPACDGVGQALLEAAATEIPQWATEIVKTERAAEKATEKAADKPTGKTPTPRKNDSNGPAQPAATEAPSRDNSSASSGAAIQVFFTNPDAPNAAKRTGGPDEELVAALQKAQKSIDMAMYNLSLDSIGNALLAAKKRGVKVRLVMETESLDGAIPEKLKDNGISIVGDQREGLMHNKFIVIDNKEVWTGSLNLTGTGTYNDNNNLVRIQSPKVAADYTNEFNKMFTDNQFGSAKKPNTPNPVVDLNGTRVEVYFSPADNVITHLVPVVKTAKKSIDFLAYSFTSDDLAQAMTDRAKAGVKIRGVFETDQVKSNKGTEYDPFKAAKYAVRLDGNKGLMHHKVIIIDNQIVVLGSYNFSANAENTNDENLVILFDPELAAQFTAEFERIYQKATP